MDSSGATVYDRIMASQRVGSRGMWSHPAALSPSGHFGGFPELAADSSGAVAAVWEEGGLSQGNTKPGLPYIDAAFKRSPASPWSRTVRISAPGVDSEGPEVAINNRGQAVAIWFTVAPHGGGGIDVSTLDVASGRWSAPVVLQKADKMVLSPQIAINRSGDAFAVWKRYIRRTGRPGFGHGDTQWWVSAAVKPVRRHSWLVRGQLGREEEPALQGDGATEEPGPHLAVDGRGGAIAVWQGGTAAHLVTDFATWENGRDAWSKQAAVSQSFALWPQVAASPAGDVTVVWEGHNDVIRAVGGHIPGRDWSKPETIGSATPPAFAPNLAVVMDRAGDAVASWTGGHPQVALRARPSGSWRRPVALSSHGGSTADVAMTSLTRAVAVWQQSSGQPSGLSVEAAAYRAL